jgi:hypothetical protein
VANRGERVGWRGNSDERIWCEGHLHGLVRDNLCLCRSGVEERSLPFTMSFTRVWSAKTSRMYSAGACCSIAGPSLPRCPCFSVWKYVAPLLTNGFSEKMCVLSQQSPQNNLYPLCSGFSIPVLAPPTIPKTLGYRRSAKRLKGLLITSFQFS